MHKEKVKIEKQCNFCNSVYIGTKRSKFCSDACRTNNIRDIFKKRIDEGTFKGWQSRNIESYPEKFFKKVLSNNNIEYLFNHPVSKNSLGVEESGCYFLDFLIDKNGILIDLEIDGKQHKYLERKENDIVRDSLLKNKNYIIYRIEWNQINNDIGKIEMENKIIKFKKWYESL